jgi:chemotaxis signal transduction protein
MNNDAIDDTQALDGAAPAARPRLLQLVRAGAAQFGIFADEIATIVAWRKPTPLPQAPTSVLGVVSVEGRMLTVLDLTSLLVGKAARTDADDDAPAAAPASDVPNGPGDIRSNVRSDVFKSLVALRGDEQLALAVADVGESIELADGEFADQQESAGTLFLGVLRSDGAEVNILNLKGLFPTAIQGRERRRRRF